MPDALQPFLDAIHASGRLRVWSIVITIFGDAVEHRGGRLAMQDLQRVTDRIGVGESALRTAMSRLAKEGWLEREKDGRNSIYRLSEARKEETRRAAKVIYPARLGAGVKTWALLLGDGDDIAGGVRLTKTSQILPWQDEVEAGDLFLLKSHAENVPYWVQCAIVPQGVREQLSILHGLLEGVPKDATADLSDLDALVLRLLTIHFWRRAVLRLPSFADDLMPDDWLGSQCHALVSELYSELWAASEKALELANPSSEAARKRFLAL